MDWLSRKLVLWQIKKYFHLENQQQIQVQLLGEHSLTCKNLKLRNSVVNTPTTKLHIQQLTINSLSINYSSTGEEPLKLSLDGAKLVLAFNPTYVDPPPSYANTKEQMKSFFDAIKSKQALQHRGFFSEEVFQLKKLVMEFFVKKVSLLIRNVDISIQYGSQGEIHAMGCELGEVNIKQRMVINHQDNDFKEMKEEQVICTLEAVSIYLGISSQQDKIEQLAYNRQILRKTKTIKKNYLLDKQKIKIFYNLNKNSMTVNLTQLQFKINKLLLVQLLKITKYLQEHLSDRPIYRPGKGEQKSIQLKGIVTNIHEGTRQWWNYAFKRILERVEQKKQFNILTNFKYRLYLFYLLYKYTYGSNSYVDKSISEYEQKKLSHSIMSAYSMILSRVDAIRNSKETQDQILYFVNFICSSKIILDVCTKYGLKKVTYQKIKSSKIYFNLANCNEYIRDYTNKSNISITVNIENSVRAEFYQSKYDKILLKDGFNLEPTNFYNLKNKYISKFYKKMTEESIKWESPFLTLQLNQIQFFKNKSQMKLNIPVIMLIAEEKDVVMKISAIMLFKENKTLFTHQNKIIVSEKNNLIKVNSVFFNLHKGLIEHMLTINALLNQNAIEPLTEQQEFDNYLEENIYKRLPKHPIFESFSDESTHIQIQKMLIVTSVFEQNQHLIIDLNSIQYGSSNNNVPPRISLQKLSVTRGRLTNLQKLKHKKIQRLMIENESVIVENNKPLALTSNKYIRRYNQYIYYESVLDILIPFILLQISFQDIYYLQLMLNYWNQLFRSQYLFPKRKGKTQSEMKVIELKQQKIQYFEKLNEFTKSSRTRIKLEGIQVIVYGENKRIPHNEVLTMLVEGILYQNKVEILNMDTTISIFNIFIQNCLGRKIFNHLKLSEIIEKKPATNQPLIYDSKYESQGSNLILYGLNETAHEQKKEDNYMIRVKIKNFFSIKKFKKNTNTSIIVKPIFFYHSPDYYKILINSLGLISRTANKHFKPTFPIPKAQAQQSDHQILQAKNISQKLILVCQIQKINLIALHQNQPIYTFSFLNVVVKHETEAYVSKYQIVAHQLYIVDISLNCGLHPIVLKAEPLQCFFTKYQSDLLKKKQKKSALLKINLLNTELFFLNRKIKELTNFIMSHFEQIQSEQVVQKPVKNEKDQQQPIQRSYPFCYRVEFVRPIIMLLRSSLSEEKMVSQAENLLIANYLQVGDQFKYNNNNEFFCNYSRQHFNNESFESCLEIKQQQIQFHSFAKAEEQLDQNPHSKIHINLINFYIYNYQQQSNNPVIFTPQIVITLVDKNLAASLKLMNINFTADDYRLLIRITEENFSELPVSYPKESVQSEQKMIGFKSSYTIQQLNMTLRQSMKQQKFGELIISNIIGVNILYTNGEKQDEITVDKMEYQSCINHNLEKIITKKEDSQFILFEFNQEVANSKKFSGLNDLLKKYQNLNQEEIESNTQDIFFKDGQKFSFAQGQEKQTVNRGNQQEHHKEETNLNRLGKWIGGMCKKCMCCCKTASHTEEEVDSKKDTKILSGHSKNQEEGEQRPKNHFDQNLFNLQQSVIQGHQEIINFSNKINFQDYRHKQKLSQCVYLHIKGERSRQKRLYMLVQHLNIYYEKNQHIMALSNFLGKPYAEPERPSYLRQAKFNNYRPFQQLYQVANTSIYVIQKEAIIERSIELNTHVLFNMQRVGDPTNGPGRKVMESDLTFKMFFNDKKTGKRTSLSDIIRLIHSKQSYVTYHNRQPVKNKQKLLLIGLNSDTVKFNFPIYIIKSLVDLAKSLGSKPKKEQKSNNEEEFEKQEIKMEEENVNIKKSLKKIQKQQKKLNQPKFINNSTKKIFYIPKIQLSIETKQTVSFIKMYLQNTHLKNKQLSQIKCQMKNQIIDLDVSIEYWNLNLGKFEPFLQNCKFIVEQKSLKRQNAENTKLKVLTKSQKDKNSFDYRDGLCINLSTALFHTYKQLQLKYLLQNEKLQLSNEICFDLTKKNTDVYEYMQNKKSVEKESFESDAFVSKFPEGLKNFFGRQFKLQDLNQLNKKKTKRNQLMKNRFHIQGLKVFLHHSYLEPKTKLKYITYRTPFRIFNVTPCKLFMKFKSINRMARGEKWSHQIISKQYYAIPQDIYHFDFLVNFIARKRLYKSQNLGGDQFHPNQMIQQQSQKNMSVKYLIQMHAKKSEYHELGRHKLNQYIFNISTLQKRWIDKRDIIIKSNKLTLCIISVKSQCQEYKDKTVDNAKVMLYDSLTIIISPIIIFNYTSQCFNITNCKKKKYELLPSKSIELNEFPPEFQPKDIVIQFLQDPVHHEYKLLNDPIGIHIRTMPIDGMQSVNIKIIKETYNTCLVQIYPDWITINQTELQFNLFYGKKQFVINQQSKNSLAIENWKDLQNKTMKIKLADLHNQQGNCRRFATDTNIFDMFMLSKVDNNPKNKQLKKQLLQKGCCGYANAQSLSDPEKSTDENVYKCIEFVITIQQSANYILTKNLTIDYRYWIINQMDYQMVIYQVSFGVFKNDQDLQERGVQILRLGRKEQSYLYSYDFLGKSYYLKIFYKDEYVESNDFLCNESIGRSLSVKLKKGVRNEIMSSNLAYHESFHHIRIDMEQVKYKNILTFSYIDGDRVKYPYYINNTTNYFVKITENGQSFKVRPKTRIPFSWSDLIKNTHTIQVQIEGQSQNYSLKDKQSFKPIQIKGDNFVSRSSSLNKKLFKKQKCYVKWKEYSGDYLVIFDIFAKKLHINGIQSFTLFLSDAQNTVKYSSKIQIEFKNHQIFQFHPSHETLKQWAEILKNNLNSNVIDKIYFTTQSFQNSMIYFIHNLQINEDNDVKIDHQEFIIQNFFLSIINSNPLRLEEILLINMQNIQIIIQNRLSSTKEQEKDSYLVKKVEETVKIGKLKINNQLKHALNPVIVSQIKKSNYPFLQIRRKKQNLLLWQDRNKSNEGGIQHYKSSIFFLDEAEIIIEAALIPQVLYFKNALDQIKNQYAYEQDEVKNEQKDKKKITNSQIYIDYLQIKPIKMTISVSFDANIDSQFQTSLISFLTLIPSGVENAIITIDSFVFHHVFMQQKSLQQKLREYYMYQMKKQVLFNAGSIQILAPFQLIKGLGIGFTSIFYNPIYELVNNKEIKSFTSNMLEGFITFILFILSLGFSVVSGIFKFLAMLTKDNNFQTKRETFRKQIFKSPMSGFSHGAKALARIFKQFFINFLTWPCFYNSKVPFFGLLFGFILSILYVIPWIIKLIITLYDFIYVIALGFISWGYYEQNSMKYRSRPIRTFPHKQLLPYDYLTSKGNEIMRKNLIQQNDNEQISFISHIESGDESKYLLLSNYRILYCSHQLTSFKEVTLYKISKVIVGPVNKNDRTGEMDDLFITVYLTFPDKNKYICFQCTSTEYQIKFKDLKSLRQFLQRLKQNLQKQSIDFNLQDATLKKYQKSLGPSSQKKNDKSQLRELF